MRPALKTLICAALLSCAAGFSNSTQPAAVTNFLLGFQGLYEQNENKLADLHVEVQQRVPLASFETALGRVTGLENGQHFIQATADTALAVAAYARSLFSALPDSAFTASSSWPLPHHQPNHCRISDPRRNTTILRGNSVWQSNPSALGPQYIRVDLGRPHYITEIHTAGRVDFGEHVKQYRISFVGTNGVERELRSVSGADLFDGNYDSSVVINKHFQPFVAISVKLYPTMWLPGGMSMKWDLIGVALEDLPLNGQGLIGSQPVRNRRRV